MTPRVVNGLAELSALAGEEIGTSDWLTVTQELIDRFAELTGDRQWIHIDSERAARETEIGRTIAHGFLTVSLLSELSRQAVDVRGSHKMKINYGFNRLRFVSPVPAGSRIRARFAVKAVEDNQVTWLVTMDLEGGSKPALVAEWLSKFY
ncbi:MAG TPA: MaoC family dehydratase [Bryobacteraceae bacterium]|jgi:acyl dehydratase|nr:MaoC family dehydratase [Bryobacteraceae bacterium]